MIAHSRLRPRGIQEIAASGLGVLWPRIHHHSERQLAMYGAARMTVAELIPPRNLETADPDRMVQASSVAARYDISVRTLDRWIKKPHLNFPKPVLLMHDIAGRVSSRLWRLGDLIAWERAKAAQHAQTG